LPLDYISYEQAQELAVFGAQVLHPIAMQPALKAGIPVRVKNSYNPEAKGTVIGRKRDKADDGKTVVGGGRLVTAITYQTDVTVLDISSTRMLGKYGFLSYVFQAFEKHKLSVDVLASSEVSVSLTLDQKQNPAEIRGLLKTLADCADITQKDGRSILTLIADVDRSSQVLATVFNVFAKENIQVEMMSQGASKVNISFIVSSDDLQKAMLKLHTCFF
jgi:aspartate kinase